MDVTLGELYEEDISNAKRILNERFGVSKTATDVGDPQSRFARFAYHPVRDENGNLLGFGISVIDVKGV